MHTTDTTDTTTIASPRRAARALAVVALLVALLGGVTVASAAPASAATTGNVTFCLRYSNGAAYANSAVYLYWADGSGRFTYWKSGATNAAGCGTWRSVPTGLQYVTVGYFQYQPSGRFGPTYAYRGETGAAWLNGGTVTQPTGYVYGPYQVFAAY